MYIIINNRPIDVYKITKVSVISSTGSGTYESALRIYSKAIGIDSKSSNKYHYLAENFLSVKKSDYRYYHTFLDRIDEISIAVSGKGIIKKKLPVVASVQSMYGNNADSDTNLPRFLEASEINWDILPESYFFDIGYEEDIFKGAYSHGNYLYSKFYDTQEEAEKARDLLLEAINTARIQAQKINI